MRRKHAKRFGSPKYEPDFYRNVNILPKFSMFRRVSTHQRLGSGKFAPRRETAEPFVVTKTDGWG